ncbi:recombinase family protein [Streptomyces sp. NPDC007025]|uniref:recombinase family protein n=1 Tax=Streptomyces sp. NPDC007025 TaxID=3364771 RepID=UPI0036B09825
MTKPRKRASLYARLSVAADAENLSLDGMIEDMRALCAREGFEEVALHVDDGKSGGYRDRDEFTAWLDDARTGRCDVLINPVTDRLTREGLNVAAAILDVVEGKDPTTGRRSHNPVRLLDTAGLDSLHGDAFRFRFVIQAEVGRAERERIRERSRNRSRRLRRAGRWGGGTAPFGYRPVPNPETDDEGSPRGWVLEIDPEEARHIREAAEALLKPEPDPLNRIARRLNHAGVKPRRADQWCRRSLVKLLTSGVVMGQVEENGRPVRDEDGNILTPWPPILTTSQVAAIRGHLNRPDRQMYKGGRQPARLLSALLTCSGCGSLLTVDRKMSRSANPRPIVFYRCPTGNQGRICPTQVSISAVPLEEHVTGLYLSAVGHMPMYRERTVVSATEDLATVEADIRDTLSDLATSADADTFARLQKLQARKEELSGQEPDRRTELVATGQTMAEYWEGAMVDDRRELLDQAFEELEISPGQRGRKGLQVERLRYRWRETDAPVMSAQEAREHASGMTLTEAVERVRVMEANGIDTSWLTPGL